MATATRQPATAQQPSAEIRQAQEVVRSILVADDLRNEPQMLESVTDRLDELQDELGELAGKQKYYEFMMKGG